MTGDQELPIPPVAVPVSVPVSVSVSVPVAVPAVPVAVPVPGSGAGPVINESVLISKAVILYCFFFVFLCYFFKWWILSLIYTPFPSREQSFHGFFPLWSVHLVDPY